VKYNPKICTDNHLPKIH